MRAANLAVTFLLELAAFASFAMWGAHVGDGLAGIVLALLAPALAILIWGLFAAPRSERRLSTRWRVPLELGIFALGAVALAARVPWACHRLRCRDRDERDRAHCLSTVVVVAEPNGSGQPRLHQERPA